MKRGERGSCQMQMTSLGVESEEEGGVAVWQGGSPVYFFHSESTPPPLLYCPSVTAGVGNVKGRTKTSLLSSLGPWPHRTPPHLQKAEPTRRPTGTKSEAEHTPTDSTIFLNLPQNWNTSPRVWFSSKLKLSMHFVVHAIFFLKKKDQTEKKKKKLDLSLFAMEWHFSRHAFCTLASKFIRNYSESKFSVFLPARRHKNGPTTRCHRGKFLSRSSQFEYQKEPTAVLTVAPMHDGCESNAWCESFIMTVGEWFYYWRERNSDRKS